jgi:hypothetical protein
MTEQPGEWLTIAEVAIRLGVSERTIKRRLAANEWPSRYEALPSGGRHRLIYLPSPGPSARAVRDTGTRAKSDERDTDRDSIRNKKVIEDDKKDGYSVIRDNYDGTSDSVRDSGTSDEKDTEKGSSATDLARIQGYLARDMELVIARAVAEAVEAAQAPLLARIEELTQAVERLSESRTEPPQGTPEAQTTIQPPEPLREAQRPAQATEKLPLSRAPLWLRFFGIRWKW